MTRDPRYDMPDTVADGTVGYPKCCERCGDDHISFNFEAFKLSGEIVCDDCADEIFEENCADKIFEENSQFGMGA